MGPSIESDVIKIGTRNSFRCESNDRIKSALAIQYDGFSLGLLPLLLSNGLGLLRGLGWPLGLGLLEERTEVDREAVLDVVVDFKGFQIDADWPAVSANESKDDTPTRYTQFENLP